MKRVLLSAAIALAAALVPAVASAQTATNTLTVTANVLGACTIDPAALAFGDYRSTADTDATATLTVNCTQGSSFWVGLGLGSNPAGSTRQMANGTERLSYELYRDAGRTQIWDDADPAPAIPHTDATNPGLSAYTATVYGRVPQAQLVAVGGYTDSVTMTVNF